MKVVNLILSILLESYCNFDHINTDLKAGILSILLESYCNLLPQMPQKSACTTFNSPRVLLQPLRERRKIITRMSLSILLESYCNVNKAPRGQLDLSPFNSPRVLLQLKILTSSSSSTRILSILLESYCNRAAFSFFRPLKG